MSLSADDGTLEWGTGEFIPVQVKAHPALDESVRVSIAGPGFEEGVGAILKVDGHAELLLFGHTTDGLGDDVETINTLGLTIANKMLNAMGWIESP